MTSLMGRWGKTVMLIGQMILANMKCDFLVRSLDYLDMHMMVAEALKQAQIQKSLPKGTKRKFERY